MNENPQTGSADAAVKDTSLLDEGDGRLQVLGHPEAQHDAGQPPPAGAQRSASGR